MRFFFSCKHIVANQALVIRHASKQIVLRCDDRPGFHFLMPGETAAEVISTELQRMTVSVSGHSAEGQKIILTLMIPFRLNPCSVRNRREQLYKIMATNAKTVLNNWIWAIAGARIRHLRAADFKNYIHVNQLERGINRDLSDQVNGTGYDLATDKTGIAVKIINIYRDSFIEENTELAILTKGLSKDDVLKMTFLKQNEGQKDIASLLLALRLLSQDIDNWGKQGQVPPSDKT